jgi:ubiquinol-cytochrome c reductase iron-sulfur subunit
LAEKKKGTVAKTEELEHVYDSGLVKANEKFADPGIEPHRVRMTDKSPAHEKAAARQVAGLFFLSMLGSIFSIWAYFGIKIYTADLSSIRNNVLLLGLGIALGLLGIGIGAVHWAKTLMPDAEVSEERHQTRGSEETRAAAVEIIKLADQESGFTRRKLIRRSLYGALALFPIPGLVLFRDLGPNPSDKLKHTMWETNRYLAHDPSGVKIHVNDIVEGGVVHVIPYGLAELGNDEATYDQMLEEKAKAAVLLVKVEDGVLKNNQGSYQNIVAYSKICTHVGCPVALYEQDTHHLLCPCHQSTFDLADGCKVIFGPASRPLPQLPIMVDSDGYLMAASDFNEPVGPSFWDRKA